MENLDLRFWTRIGTMNRNAGFSRHRAEAVPQLPTEVGVPNGRFRGRVATSSKAATCQFGIIPVLGNRESAIRGGGWPRMRC